MREHEQPALEVRVNFGVFAGRNATQAEIDDLAGLAERGVESFAILAEERHEFGNDVESVLRQVVIEVAQRVRRGDVDGSASGSSRAPSGGPPTCIHERSELGELGSEL